MDDNNSKFGSGPFILLKKSLTASAKIYVLTNDHHKFTGYLRSFDKHCNLIIENVTEIWHEKKKNNKKIITKEKYSPIIFLRGDTIIIVSKFHAN
ncbi:small nuclear ribonucleoprotein Sm D2 (nucleomorph) [Lotharella oceanica]|uniref:Small nuclear ribonucleoprotein Sm D2 n=1 Tax=Lotharella oceanica TaxID=641309 RepID=A0A060DAU4_9EUKA|nr:small nuclear ribonucleoprotein Sm D2 [Lotharella oceanica]|mmetsp:Transcript_3294/g.6406  ORF Transcript_3294/g.6406 Transcript_3294/m.6406 type:complete len:95 (-) Transcript_3294:688-972(-)